MNIPEHNNKVPDILDEARWELEFVLKMQVPEGKPLAGMVHHKIHDEKWTELPIGPQEDPQPRYLQPPTTAATLNLAANAAQARASAPDRHGVLDPLRDRRGDAPTRRPRPTRRSTPPDRRQRRRRVRRQQRRRRVLLGGGRAVPHHRGAELPGRPDRLAAPHRRTCSTPAASAGRAWPRWAASTWPPCRTGCPPPTWPGSAPRSSPPPTRYLAELRRQAYGLPMPGDANSYFWGGNSNVINNAVVLATAFDLTRNPDYRDGAVQAHGLHPRPQRPEHLLRHRLGRARRAEPAQPHLRPPARPEPAPTAGRLPRRWPERGPPGPVRGAAAGRLRAEFCYIDDIDSYSTNEVAINWNSTLAWMAVFLADQG